MSSPKTLEIESMAYGGRGVARDQGKVYFVQGAIPADKVEAVIEKEGKSHNDARIVRILKASPYRRRSNCEFSNICGGCQWQGVDYAQQQSWKVSFVQSALERIANLDVSVDFLSADPIYHYRNRVFLRARLKREGTIVAGYFRAKSRELVAIDRCSIAGSRINRFIEFLYSLREGSIAPKPLRIEIQEVIKPDGVTVLIYPASANAAIELKPLVEQIVEFPEVRWVGTPQDLKNSDFFQYDAQEGLTYYTKPGIFQQVNIDMNQKLRGLIRELVAGEQPERVLDLFCGSGNLSLQLSKQVDYIEGVEQCASSIGAARHNVMKNRLSQVCYREARTEKHLWHLLSCNSWFDLVVADPPRQGMAKELAPLKLLLPKTIIYVSCDPTTLARDIASLCQDGTYKLKRVVALDFFPNTFHVETVAVLSRVCD